MKYTTETEIAAPLATVGDLVGDPARWIDWLEGLKEVEHLDGTPGEPGAESRLTFETGGTTMDFHGTVVERNLPDEYRLTMEAPHVLVTISTRLEAVTPETTRYVSVQTFEFRGLRDRLLGQLMRPMFKRQTRRHVQNFKALAESSSDAS